MIRIQPLERARGIQPHRRIAHAQPVYAAPVVERRNNGASHSSEPRIVDLPFAQSGGGHGQTFAKPGAGRAAQRREFAGEHLDRDKARRRAARCAAHAVGKYHEQRSRLSPSRPVDFQHPERVLLIGTRALPLPAGQRPSGTHGGTGRHLS